MPGLASNFDRQVPSQKQNEASNASRQQGTMTYKHICFAIVLRSCPVHKTVATAALFLLLLDFVMFTMQMSRYGPLQTHLTSVHNQHTPSSLQHLIGMPKVSLRTGVGRDKKLTERTGSSESSSVRVYCLMAWTLIMISGGSQGSNAHAAAVPMAWSVYVKPT